MNADFGDLETVSQPLSNVVLAPHSSGAVLHDCTSGRLFFLNHTAHVICRWVRDGQRADDVVDALVGRLGIEREVAARDVAVFLEAARNADLMGGETPVDGTDFSELAAPQRKPCLDGCYRIGDLAVRVVCHVPEIAPSLAALAAPAEVGKSPRAESCLTLHRQGDALILLRDGRLLQRLPTAPLARWALVRELVRSGRRRTWLSLMHAGAVVSDGGALLVLGDSGAGKSTLLAGLLARGLPFIADDIVPLEAGSTCVWPVPLALSVKQGSWSVVEALFPEIATQPAIAFGTRTMRYLKPPSMAVDTGYPIAGAVFPNYVADARPRSERLDPERSLVMLGEGGSEFPDSDARLSAFLALWDGIPTYRITYGRLDDALAEIQRLFGLGTDLGDRKQPCEI